MTTALKSTAPPAPTATAVKAHKRTLELSLLALKSGAPALALALARGETGAQSALAALHARIGALEWELSLNPEAVELARAEDQAKAEEWRSAILEMPAEDAIEGIARDSCPRLCVPGSYCVISNPCARSGSVCAHAVTQKHLWSRDETGKTHYPYSDNPRSYELHLAACRKLKVSPS